MAPDRPAAAGGEDVPQPDLAGASRADTGTGPQPNAPDREGGTDERERGTDEGDGMRRVRGMRRPGLLAALGVLTAATFGTPAGASAPAPYSDPDAVGYIGLCNQQGQQITSGSISTAPFAWRAVSSVAAQAPYDSPSGTAILMAYQPIEGLAPPDWSGDQLTASSRYSNPAHPMAAATATDWSLAQFIGEFKPIWDGFFQLRLYLGAPNEPAYSVHYPALDIEVTGDTWHAVDGGPVDCAAGTATSIETLLLPASQLRPPGSASHAPSGTKPTNATAHGEGGAGHGGTGTPTASAASAPGAHQAGSTGGAAAPAAPASSTGKDVAAGVAVALVLLGAVALGAVLVRLRRRRPATEASADDADTAAPPEPGASVASSSTTSTTSTTSLAVSSTKGTPR